jgi:multicomponent Na+:H+ antiporter subunit D
VPALPVVICLLAAAALVGGAPLLRRRLADLVAIAASATVTVLCVLLLVRAVDGPVAYWFGGWTPRGGVALGVAFAVDPVGAALATLAGVLTTAGLVFSWRYFEAVGTLFHALMLVFLAAIIGFCLSGDLFNMFVFFELLSVAAYALAGYQIEDPGSLQGALNFGITNSIGAFLILDGIALLYGRTGALNLAQLGNVIAAGPADRLVLLAFVLLMAGLFVKAAVVPFHFWLPDAYAMAPTPVGVLFAGVISELGLYAVARVYWTVFSGGLAPSTPGLRAILVGVAVLTALVGAVMCVLQHHLARLLAYATVSHIGLTLAGVALLQEAGLAGAVLYAVADGLVKGALFLAVGILQHHLGSVDELALRGRGRGLVWTFGLFVAGALALAGVPPFAGFLGKALMEEAGNQAGLGWLALVYLVVSALTLAALLRATGRIFLGWGPAEPAPAEAGDTAAATEGPEQEREIVAPRPRRLVTLLTPPAVLLAAALALGLVPGLTGQVEEAAARFTDREAYAGAVLEGAAAPAPAAVRHEPGHLTVPALLSLASVLLGGGLALGALFRDRLPAGPRGLLSGVWRPAAAALRALHGGHIGDSVTWLVVGVASLGALLVVAVR